MKDLTVFANLHNIRLNYLCNVSAWTYMYKLHQLSSSVSKRPLGNSSFPSSPLSLSLPPPSFPPSFPPSPLPPSLPPPSQALPSCLAGVSPGLCLSSSPPAVHPHTLCDTAPTTCILPQYMYIHVQVYVYTYSCIYT